MKDTECECGSFPHEDEEEDDGLGGGVIDNICPDCGQFCKRPETYLINGLGQDAHAIGYCKRCKKEIRLGVSFY